MLGIEVAGGSALLRLRDSVADRFSHFAGHELRVVTRFGAKDLAFPTSRSTTALTERGPRVVVSKTQILVGNPARPVLTFAETGAPHVEAKDKRSGAAREVPLNASRGCGAPRCSHDKMRAAERARTTRAPVQQTGARRRMRRAG